MFPNPSPGVARATADIDVFLAELRAHLAAARWPARGVVSYRARIDAQYPGLLGRRARRRLVRGLPAACRN